MTRDVLKEGRRGGCSRLPNAFLNAKRHFRACARPPHAATPSARPHTPKDAFTVLLYESMTLFSPYILLLNSKTTDRRQVNFTNGWTTLRKLQPCWSVFIPSFTILPALVWPGHAPSRQGTAYVLNCDPGMEAVTDSQVSHTLPPLHPSILTGDRQASVWSFPNPKAYPSSGACEFEPLV